MEPPPLPRPETPPETNGACPESGAPGASTIGLTPPGLPAKPPGPAFGQAMLLCLVFLGGTFAGAIPVVVAYIIIGSPPDMMVVMLAAQMCGWPIALWAALRLSRSAWAECYALKPFPLRTLPALVLGCAGLTILLQQLASFIPMPESVKEQGLALMGGHPALLFLSVVLVAPFTEELFFRGWMLRGFLCHYSVRSSVGLTALLFAMIHLNPWQAVVAFPLGVLFAWLVLRTGSIVPGMIGHFVVNLTASFLLGPLGAVFGYSQQELEDMTHVPVEMLMVGLILSVLGLGFLRAQLTTWNPPEASDPTNVC